MFYTLRNLLALVGLIVIAAIIYAAIKFEPAYRVFQSFDEKALEVYTEMGERLLETGNMAEATVWKRQVDEGLSAAEVEEVMKFVANEHNIKNVGELPLYQEIKAMSGKDHRYVKIFMFCNALTASRMMAYSDAFSAYLPCRVSMLEDKDGKLWLYTLNMDGMIYGGTPLPPALKEEAIGVKTIILDIMNRGATGEF
ncbi:MAG: DUF302 domain-containing protein [Gammaproteobacteria bacterium]